MGSDCASLVENLFLFCYEKDFMTSLSDDNQTDMIPSFYSAPRYLDDLFNIENPFHEEMVNQIYPPELQLNKAYTSNTKALFLDFHLSISYGFLYSKMYGNTINFLSWMAMFHVSPLM